MNKKLIVCGDSYCSADRNRPGTHFSELLSQQGHNVINLARGGISNTGICFQIEQAIKLSPDLVIFSSTVSDRIDIPVKNRKFNPGNGLKNFIYPYESDSSTGSKYVGGLDSAIMSDVIPAFINPRPDLPERLVDSNLVKEYFIQFHNTEFKQVTDSWILGYWKYTLAEKSIPYIHLFDGGPIAQAMYQYSKQNPTLTNQCVYHTDEITQMQVAKDIMGII